MVIFQLSATSLNFKLSHLQTKTQQHSSIIVCCLVEMNDICKIKRSIPIYIGVLQFSLDI